MATLAELAVLHSRGTAETEALLDKVRGAVLVAAETIREEAPTVEYHPERLAWAKQAMMTPRTAAEELWGAMIAANHTATIGQILNASDTAIQAAVNDAINLYAVV